MIGVVIPCFNEASRLPVESFIEFYNTYPAYFFCFVNDGSHDNTLAILQKFRENREDRISIVTYDSNVGKAEAVRRGVHHLLAIKDLSYLGYLDADLSTPLSELHTIYTILVSQAIYEIVCGSRIKRMGSFIDRKLSRHLIGRFFATLFSAVLEMPFYDTQCGAKVFTRQIAQLAFHSSFVSKWLFDVELFIRMKKYYGNLEAQSKILEYPLHVWIEKGQSKIAFKDFFRIPLDLLRIINHYR
jgi:dolichyl-phosphate beta-glucosyltransferase